VNGTPNKLQKDWHQYLRDRGCCVQDEMSYSPLSIHHIIGAKAKLKGVKKFGEKYVICLSYWWHQDGRNGAARHINKKAFELETGKTEKEWFIDSMQKYKDEYGHIHLVMTEEEYQIIKARA